jgi:hypothetical protein
MAMITTSPAIAPRLRRNRRQIARQGPASSDHPIIASSPDCRMRSGGAPSPGAGDIVGDVMIPS